MTVTCLLLPLFPLLPLLPLPLLLLLPQKTVARRWLCPCSLRWGGFGGGGSGGNGLRLGPQRYEEGRKKGEGRRGNRESVLVLVPCNYASTSCDERCWIGVLSLTHTPSSSPSSSPSSVIGGYGVSRCGYSLEARTVSKDRTSSHTTFDLNS